MVYEDWVASARRMPLAECAEAKEIHTYFEQGDGKVPGREVILFGKENSWLVVIPQEDGTESYFVVANRWADEVLEYNRAVEILWREHARHEQEEALDAEIGS